jgi:hypothetical protein
MAKLRVLVLGALSIAGAFRGPAHASCLPITFGQLAQACSAGSAYCYVHSPGLDTTDSILGSFWALGYGDPSLGSGNDNGSWALGQQWLRGGASGAYLAGDWSDPRVDGCIAGRIPPGESAEVMTVALSDTDVFRQEGFFAVAAVGRHAMGSPEFDFSTGLQRDILFARIPLPPLGVSPTLASFAPVTAQDVAPGFYSDGAVTQSQVIVGYRIYYHDGANVPQDRHRAAWNVFSPVVPLGQSYGSPQCFCCGGNSGTLSFVVSLVFVNGFETDYVSRHRTVHPCIPENSFDGDGDGDIPPQYGGTDCNDFDSTIYWGAPEVNDGVDNQCPGDRGRGSIDEISGLAGLYHPGDKSKLTWHVQGGASSYRVARADRPDFAGSCTMTLTPLGTLTDPAEPAPGMLFSYLVSAAAPHAGSWGTDSSGDERAVGCPWPHAGVGPIFRLAARAAEEPPCSWRSKRSSSRSGPRS